MICVVGVRAGGGGVVCGRVSVLTYEDAPWFKPVSLRRPDWDVELSGLAEVCG